MKLLIFWIILTMQVSASAEASLCDRVAQNLNEGDLIFLDIDSVIFEQVAKATQTWTSHVGVAIYKESQWHVAESTLPLSKITPLCKYLSKTQDERVEVRRLVQPMSEQQMLLLKDELSQHMGIFYDTGFNFESSKMFCSKLVYVVFKSALDLEVGSIKPLKVLLKENPDGNTTFWKWWYFGNIPWERKTVTPKDQLIDEDFITVFKNGTH